MGIGPDVASVDENGPSPGWGKCVSDGHATFVICRGMESTTKDPDYPIYKSQCQLLGIPVSPYLFLHFPKTGVAVPEPEVQVDDYIAYVGIDKNQMVPALDLEQRRTQCPSMGPDAWFDWAHRAWLRLKSTIGACPLVYCSAEWWADTQDGLAGHPAPDMARSPGWFKYSPYPIDAPAVYDLAKVAALPSPACPTPWSGQWFYQQYQLDATGYPGLKSTCDLSRFNVLKLGSKGASVVMLQRLLGGIACDGDFGPVTQTALEAFQKSEGLTPDGVFGPKSAARLFWRNT